jgi:hypothetical protein
MILGRSCSYELAIAPVTENLERVLANGRRATPDQNCVLGVRRGSCGNWPGEGKPEIGGHGVKDGDKVVPKNNCLLGRESNWDLSTWVNDGSSLILNGKGGLTFPNRYSGAAQNS